MLTCILGTNTDAKSKHLKDAIVSLEKKHDGIQILRMTPQDVVHGTIESYVRHSTDLFAQKTIIVLPYLFEEGVEYFSNTLLSDMHASSNYFFIVDHDVPKETKAFLLKQKIPLQNESEVKKKIPEITPFKITDALILRDKKKAWVTLTQFQTVGVSIESIIGIIFWQIKILLIVKESSSVEYLLPLDLKPFTLSQAKKGTQKYTIEELHHMAYLFGTLISRARRNNNDPYIEFEKSILTLF